MERNIYSPPTFGKAGYFEAAAGMPFDEGDFVG
jgi:hypothetical protein